MLQEKTMTKFKITRERRIEDEETKADTLIVFSKEYSSLRLICDTKDLPDLIKALQDKEKEIHGN